MVNTMMSYRLIASDMTRSLQRVSKEPLVERETAYYKETIGKVKSIDAFMSDTGRYNYAMKAFGVEDMAYAKAFVRKILTEGIKDDDAMANKLTDKRYKEFATTFAHDVANISTPGFRGEGTKFNTIVSKKAREDVNFATLGKSYIRTEAGSMLETGNPFDVAVKGDAWMAVNTPQGVVYTRDDRMKMMPPGELVSVTGNSVLDVGSAIYQNGAQIGAIGLFSIPADADLSCAGNSGVVRSKPAQAVVDDMSVGVVQGMIEGSNVDGMTEMTRFISVTRAFEQVNNLLSQQESMVAEAIRTLGSKNG